MILGDVVGGIVAAQAGDAAADDDVVVRGEEAGDVALLEQPGVFGVALIAH